MTGHLTIERSSLFRMGMLSGKSRPTVESVPWLWALYFSWELNSKLGSMSFLCKYNSSCANEPRIAQNDPNYTPLRISLLL